MNRIALLLAAVGLGSGCVVQSSPTLGSATLYWSLWNSALLGNFGLTTDSATQVCAKAGVNQIDITLISPSGVAQPVSTGPCVTTNGVPGTVFLDLSPGTWDYRIEGFRAGVLVFSEDSRTTPGAAPFVVTAGNDIVVDTRPRAIYWDVQLNFTVPSCIATDTIEFNASDTTYGVLYSTDLGTTNPPVRVGCLAPATMVIPSVPPAVTGVSSGSYVLSNVRQLDKNGLLVNYPSCIPHWVQGASNTTIGVTINSGTNPPQFGC